jgi:hypothetical protein
MRWLAASRVITGHSFSLPLRRNRLRPSCFHLGGPTSISLDEIAQLATVLDRPALTSCRRPRNRRCGNQVGPLPTPPRRISRRWLSNLASSVAVFLMRGGMRKRAPRNTQSKARKRCRGIGKATASGKTNPGLKNVWFVAKSFIRSPARKPAAPNIIRNICGGCATLRPGAINSLPREKKLGAGTNSLPSRRSGVGNTINLIFIEKRVIATSNLRRGKRLCAAGTRSLASSCPTGTWHAEDPFRRVMSRAG